MKTFTFPPQWNMKRQAKPNVTVVNFGDGYEQRAAKGIHADLRRYDVEFKGTEAYINRIDAFLTEHGGYQAFQWTPPYGKASRFKCEEWNITYATGFLTLTATFQEVIA